MKRCALAVMISLTLAACGGDEIIDTSQPSELSKPFTPMEAAGLYGGQQEKPLIAILNGGRYYVVSYTRGAILLIHGTKSKPLGKGHFSSLDAKLFNLSGDDDKSQDIIMSAELDENDMKRTLKITPDSELNPGLQEIKEPYNPEYEQKIGIQELAEGVFHNSGATTFLARKPSGEADKANIHSNITLTFTEDGVVTYTEDEESGLCSATGKVSEIADAGHVYDISLEFRNKTQPQAESCAYNGQKLSGVVIYTPHKKWHLRTLLTNEARSEAMVLRGKKS